MLSIDDFITRGYLRTLSEKNKDVVTPIVSDTVLKFKDIITDRKADDMNFKRLKLTIEIGDGFCDDV